MESYTRAYNRGVMNSGFIISFSFIGGFALGKDITWLAVVSTIVVLLWIIQHVSMFGYYKQVDDVVTNQEVVLPNVK